MLTQEILKQRLHYDPLTGVFTWLKSNNSSIADGQEAGTLNGWGYKQIGINNKYYLAHRLAFLYMTGDMPKEQVDHIDHVKANNVFSNLRLVSCAVNNKNQGIDKRNKTGVTGVKYRAEQDRYIARIGVDKVDVYLGCFKDIDAAISARKQAEKQYGFHENHGKQ